MRLRSRGGSSDGESKKPPSSSHSSGGSHQFFKVFLPDQSSKQLRIPPAFVRHLRGPFPMVSILEGPTDKAWFVNVKEVDGSVVLEKGWENFVADTCLEFGDFLMFSYNGFSKFKVSIYGKNGCEKEFDARKVEKRGKKGNSGKELTHENGTIVVKVEDSEEIPSESDSRKRKYRTSDARAVQEDKKTKTCKELLLCPVNNAQLTIMMQTLCPGRSLLNDNAVKAATKFKSKNPHFVVVMHESHLRGGRITVPINFVKEYMKKNLRNAKTSKVELRISNNTWDVELKLYPPRKFMLASGWIDFARANRLLAGDVCVFEMTKTDDFVFEVSIFRS